MNDPLAELRSTRPPVEANSEMIGRVRADLIDRLNQPNDVGLNAVSVPENGFPNDFEWSDLAEPKITGRRQRTPVLVALVILSLLGGLTVATVWGDSVSQSTTNTASEAESQRAPSASAPAEPIYGVEEPIVVVTDGPVDRRECSVPAEAMSGVVAGLVGRSPVVEAFASDVGIGAIDWLVTVVEPGIMLTCDSQGRSGWSLGVVEARFGPPNNAPTVVVVGGGDEQSADFPGRVHFQLEGWVDDSVDSIMIVGSPYDQVFHRFGGAFRLLAVTSGSDAAPGNDLKLEIRYVDGTTETRPAYIELTSNCLGDEHCLGLWLQFFHDEAKRAEGPAQAAALADYVLTQEEFDAAVTDFRDCLQTDLPSTVVAGSAESAQVSRCYTLHVEFLDRARATLNAAWLATPAGQERGLGVPDSSEVETVGDAE